MANNRMWLKHRGTGHKILIAKTMDDWNWTTRGTAVPIDGGDRLTLEEALAGLINHAQEGTCESSFRFNDFEIEFEHDPDRGR